MFLSTELQAESKENNKGMPWRGGGFLETRGAHAWATDNIMFSNVQLYPFYSVEPSLW